MAKRQALGREATVGELYDIRTDRFCNKSMFASTPPARAVRMEDVQLYEFRASSPCDVFQIMSMFRAEGELQLSVASGFCEVKGLASLLTFEAQANAPRNELQGILFTYKTKKVKLCLDGLCNFMVAAKALKTTGQATHAIEEVTYGANAFLGLDFEGEDVNAQAKEDSLKNLLKIVEDCVCGRPYNKYQNVITFLNRRCRIQVFSDTSGSTVTRNMPSVQHALDHLKSIPNLLRDIGIPLSYGLIPISKVRSLLNPNSKANQQLVTVPNEMVFQVIKRLEENVRIRRKVGSLFFSLQENSCISGGDLKNVFAIRTLAETNEKEFKQELAAVLVEVRSGRRPGSVLQDFCAGVRPNTSARIGKMLVGLTDAYDKAEFVCSLLQRGARCVSNDYSLENIVANMLGKDVRVLHYSTKARKANQAQWNNYKKEFLKAVNDPNAVAVLFDHDVSGSEDISQMKIDLYKSGKMIGGASTQPGKNGPDVPESLCYAESLEVGPTVVLPKRRAYLRLPCPGASSFEAHKTHCSSFTKMWHCKKCQSTLMYGFDETFYCSCGSASCWSFRFMCDDNNHGAQFVPASLSDVFSRAQFAQALRSLAPLQELNILLLGETGVGKSTWINSFVNYLTYETMEEAERDGPRYLIGSSFVMTDDKYHPVEIKMGAAENENNSKGQSTTQMPNSYVFSAGELMVRLVDTPGVGDTRGIEQDKVNFQNVLSHLAHLEDIHGICILLKSNSARMTITFQFCIKELLTHLHKDACKNIVFVFTNARETFYRPGDTFSTLRNLLLENRDIVIELGKETIYCMDNEAVRFLAASKQGMTFRPEDKANYSISWKTSVAENERLVQHILSLKSHSTKKTLSLNEARRLILGLTEPLAQISQNIQNNIILAQNRRNEITGMVKRKGDLKGKLSIPVIDLEANPIPYPRTVCTSSRCTERIDIDGITKVNYKTWCHEHCYLKNVLVQQYPCPELQNCTAMINADSCSVCGCSWEVHMHVTYESVEVMKKTVDKNIERLLSMENNSINAVEAFIKDVEQRIVTLKREQEIINKVASKCGNFLKQNAITPYNDSVDEYLQQCIRIQKDLVYAGGSDSSLRGLEKMLASYRQEVKILEISMKGATGGPKIYPEDIPKLIGELYKLPINGKTLKDFVDVAMKAKTSMALYQEKVYDPPMHKSSAGFLTRAWNKASNLFGTKTF